MPTPPTTRAAIAAALVEHGPMTGAELIEVLGMPAGTVTSSISQARSGGRTTYLRVVAWRRQIGHGGREAAVFDVGPGEDVRRPTFGAKARREVHQRYEEAHRAKRRIATALRRNSKVNPFKQLVRVWRDQRQEQQ